MPIKLQDLYRVLLRKVTEAIRGLVTLAVVGGGFFLACWAVLSFVVPDDWPLKYALLNSVPYSQVKIDRKPKDCDWGHAPIGDKDCHYEAAISEVDWAISTTGEPIVSYDAKKTWSFADSPVPKATLPTAFIYVSWNKVADP